MGSYSFLCHTHGEGLVGSKCFMGENMAKHHPITYSIILATYVHKPEHIEMVQNCIADIKRLSTDFELIIVDDDSDQNTEFLSDEATTYIRHTGGNKGCAVGWNDGLKVATGKYLVVISDDVFVRPGWLECMREALDAFPNALAAMPAVTNMPSGSQMEENRVWVPASIFMLRPECLKIVGYFDESFFPFNYEDVDYWTRISQSGHTIARNYRVQVLHKEGQVIHSIEGHAETDQKNRKHYLEKWGFDPIPILYGSGKFPWE